MEDVTMYQEEPQEELYEEDNYDEDFKKILSVSIEDCTHLSFNNETINNYMDLITQRSSSVHAFHADFYTSFIKKGYSHISQWTKNVDIFDKKKLLFPIYLKQFQHWCLACVDFPKKTIIYYDGFYRQNNFCLRKIFLYLMHEHMNKKGKPFNGNGYMFLNMRNCPQQENRWDSGVFACVYAEHLSRNERMEFTQADMENFRTQIKYEIENKMLIFKEN